MYIYKCQRSVVSISGKPKVITVDNCAKVGLVFDSVVAMVEVLNCKDVKVQVKVSVPTVNIDKVDTLTLYLEASDKSKLLGDIVTT